MLLSNTRDIILTQVPSYLIVAIRRVLANLNLLDNFVEVELLHHFKLLILIFWLLIQLQLWEASLIVEMWHFLNWWQVAPTELLWVSHSFNDADVAQSVGWNGV